MRFMYPFKEPKLEFDLTTSDYISLARILSHGHA